MTIRTIQLPIETHNDIKMLAAKEAAKLNISRMSKVAYLQRLIAREKGKN